ncbi:MAG: tRNA (N6-threonylcarbamoyladenosine(37)-N6)-methyltransferase TrmO [Lachnospiraceae bacterium]|nr:tRNA (N6-threonylcarbamoyladenosine(37)-N6)-methyltransferase TrmO [Lachnospiraceae bacterium]
MISCKNSDNASNNNIDETKIIAHIETSFPTKFGLPRQSGIVPELTGRIVFEEKYRVADAFRGLEDFDYIWVIWKFSEAVRSDWSPTVRPPRLGGNTRMGVFATRSPYRPNPIGLSCLKLEKIDYEAKDGPVLIVSGIDMMSGTPVYDVKPYLPYADAKTDARGGFTNNTAFKKRLPVVFEEGWDGALAEAGDDSKSWLKDALVAVLSLDPRPSYQDDPKRIYGFEFEDYEVKFRVENDTVYVKSITFCQK